MRLILKIHLIAFLIIFFALCFLYVKITFYIASDYFCYTCCNSIKYYLIDYFCLLICNYNTNYVLIRKNVIFSLFLKR